MGMPFAALCFLEHTHIIENICEAQSSARCIMLGRAKMSSTPPQIKTAIQKYGLNQNVLEGWADEYLKWKGINHVEALDNSTFEGATIIWNLNKPITFSSNQKVLDRLGSYDLVLDYGTSEHIFNPAVSFVNSFTLCRVGGFANLMLPVCGWVDHGFFQLSPSVFYAMENESLQLEYLFFWIYDSASSKITYWDGLNPYFKEHIHGAFDGSFLANCLEYLDKPVMAWAVFRKVKNIDVDDFLVNTQQLVYKGLWQGESPMDSSPAKLSAYRAKFLRKGRLKSILMRESMHLPKSN